MSQSRNKSVISVTNQFLNNAKNIAFYTIRNPGKVFILFLLATTATYIQTKEIENLPILSGPDVCPNTQNHWNFCFQNVHDEEKLKYSPSFFKNPAYTTKLKLGLSYLEAEKIDTHDNIAALYQAPQFSNYVALVLTKLNVRNLLTPGNREKTIAHAAYAKEILLDIYSIGLRALTQSDFDSIIKDKKLLLKNNIKPFVLKNYDDYDNYLMLRNKRYDHINTPVVMQYRPVKS